MGGIMIHAYFSGHAFFNGDFLIQTKENPDG